MFPLTANTNPLAKTFVDWGVTAETVPDALDDLPITEFEVLNDPLTAWIVIVFVLWATIIPATLDEVFWIWYTPSYDLNAPVFEDRVNIVEFTTTFWYKVSPFAKKLFVFDNLILKSYHL